MTVVDTPPPRTSEDASTAPAPKGRASARSEVRDAGIDLARVLCVLAVLLLHGLQVAVTVDGAGPVLEYATRGAAWYAPVTWFLQVMPLFFVIGGFAGLLAHRRSTGRGGTAAAFMAGRVHRLLLPAVVTVGAVGAGLAALSAAGLPVDLIREISLRYSEPLWFLGVFLAVQALLPVMVGLHMRAPRGTLTTLATAAAGVDVLRLLCGIDAFGYANLAFVWLALQQLGFFLADGELERMPARWRAGIGGAALGLLALSITLGVHSPDLIAHLNPPTTALLLLGLAQTMLLTLVRGRLRSLAERPRVGALTAFVTARTMTIYLWNLPVLLLMAGASAHVALLGTMTLPEPSSPGWWLTRPAWLAVSVLLTFGVGAMLGGVERCAPRELTTRPREALRGVLLGVGAVLLLLIVGTRPLTVTVAVLLMVLALRQAGGASRRRETTGDREGALARLDLGRADGVVGV